MHLPHEYVLFTAADTLTMQGKTLEDFEIMLVYNILFEDKILMHDAYHANSEFLYQHIAKYRYRESLFELAADNALVVTAYRDSSTTSLEEGIKRMEADYGENYPLAIKKADEVTVKRLCGCVNNGGQNFFWAEGKNPVLGLSYEQVLREMLQDDNQVQKHSHLGNGDPGGLWERTREWRTDLIDEAAYHTKRKGQQGIQRAEIYNRLCLRLGVSDISKLRGGNAGAAKAFMRWVSQCQQLNMAKSFGSSLTLPDYDLEEDFVANDLLKPKEPHSWEDKAPLVCPIKLPTNDMFLKRLEDSSHTLIDIRLSKGKSYLESLRAWRSNPTEGNKKVAAEMLREYCDEICNCFLKDARSLAGVAIFQRLAEKSAEFIPQELLKGITGEFVKVMGSEYKVKKPFSPDFKKTDLHIYHRL